MTNEELKRRRRRRRIFLRTGYFSLLTIVLAVFSFFSIDKVYKQTYRPPHIHNYTCYDNFIRDRVLEIPKNNGIPAIIHLQTKFKNSEVANDTNLYPLNLYMVKLSSTFKRNSLLRAIEYFENPRETRECIFHIYNDIKEVSTILLPEMQKNTFLNCFASRDAVETAETTLANIHSSINRSYKDKELPITHKFHKYGNAIIITLEESANRGLKINTDNFEYDIGDKILPQAKDAYALIAFNNRAPVFIKEGNNVTSAFYALQIEDFTRKVCMECHSLDGYCESLANAN